MAASDGEPSARSPSTRLLTNALRAPDAPEVLPWTSPEHAAGRPAHHADISRNQHDRCHRPRFFRAGGPLHPGIMCLHERRWSGGFPNRVRHLYFTARRGDLRVLRPHRAHQQYRRNGRSTAMVGGVQLGAQKRVLAPRLAVLDLCHIVRRGCRRLHHVEETTGKRHGKGVRIWTSRLMKPCGGMDENRTRHLGEKCPSKRSRNIHLGNIIYLSLPFHSPPPPPPPPPEPEPTHPPPAKPPTLPWNLISLKATFPGPSPPPLILAKKQTSTLSSHPSTSHSARTYSQNPLPSIATPSQSQSYATWWTPPPPPPPAPLLTSPIPSHPRNLAKKGKKKKKSKSSRKTDSLTSLEIILYRLTRLYS